jgi:hypothetical protein
MDLAKVSYPDPAKGLYSDLAKVLSCDVASCYVANCMGTEKLEHSRECIADGDGSFGEWSFEKWSHSENGRLLAISRIGRS